MRREAALSRGRLPTCAGRCISAAPNDNARRYGSSTPVQDPARPGRAHGRPGRRRPTVPSGPSFARSPPARRSCLTLPRAVIIVGTPKFDGVRNGRPNGRARALEHCWLCTDALGTQHPPSRPCRLSPERTGAPRFLSCPHPPSSLSAGAGHTDESYALSPPCWSALAVRPARPLRWILPCDGRFR